MSLTLIRPRRSILAAGAAFALLSLAGCSSSSSTPAPASPSASASSEPASSPAAGGSTVTIKNFAFSPANLTVAPGTTITVTNDDSTAHTFTATGAKAFDTGPIDPGKSATVTAPAAAGSYPYNCTIHPFMKGTLTVK
ncbi:plastocyanin [Kitasatospora sp. MAA4]|uniref:cupredoxin domain-containing protein n=1 Tax=Kitasatospora sp. MAA4 TaxID=3035093 RepID=UPI002476B53C|nr:cupredoxin domain-containing protein [Kitasatospora sp. MAA4]MDH6135610.1 plastocyanin [Kitasatospora sp. MAA4]